MPSHARVAPMRRTRYPRRMQVTLDKQYPVAAPADAAWQVLSNVVELATCMPGAQITERVDDAHYKGSVKVKVGPAVAAFAGTIEVLGVDAATRTLRMVGKGADRAGSSASMDLTARIVEADGAAASALVGQAEVVVSGKFAQFGGRMMTSVSDMILAQFADTFAQKAAAQAAASAASFAPAAAGAPATAAPAIPEPVAAPKELDALAIAWELIRNFVARLFGRRH